MTSINGLAVDPNGTPITALAVANFIAMHPGWAGTVCWLLSAVDDSQGRVHVTGLSDEDGELRVSIRVIGGPDGAMTVVTDIIGRVLEQAACTCHECGQTGVSVVHKGSRHCPLCPKCRLALGMADAEPPVEPEEAAWVAMTLLMAVRDVGFGDDCADEAIRR